MKAEAAGKLGVVAFVLLWIAGILLTVGFWGVVIWAIIKLVHHFAG